MAGEVEFIFTTLLTYGPIKMWLSPSSDCQFAAERKQSGDVYWNDSKGMAAARNEQVLFHVAIVEYRGPCSSGF